jgi:hypothetical protein
MRASARAHYRIKSDRNSFEKAAAGGGKGNIMKVRLVILTAILIVVTSGFAIAQDEPTVPTNQNQPAPMTTIGQPIVVTPLVPLSFVNTPIIKNEIMLSPPVLGQWNTARAVAVPSNSYVLALLTVAALPPAVLPPAPLLLAFLDPLVLPLSGSPIAALPFADLPITQLGQQVQAAR